MSKISLSPSPTGSAVYTIASPAGSTDRTLNLPDAAGTVFVGGQALSATTGSFSGNVTLGSSVLETPLGSAPSFTCRAFVNFNGTGTVAIRASGNVSSITDNGVGLYTVNFTTAMPDANYSTVVTASAQVGFVNDGIGIGCVNSNSAPTTTGVRVMTGTSNQSGSDSFSVFTNVAIFR